MVRVSVVAIQSAVQVAMINSLPRPFESGGYNPGWIAQKSITAAQNAMNVAESIQKLMSEIKPWREFAR